MSVADVAQGKAARRHMSASIFAAKKSLARPKNCMIGHKSQENCQKSISERSMA
ncbi:hypothetical protein RGR602_PC01495 (plasmid) [Rhizobium gallicum bv. gallicum R602sp]|uniref:Uncharacterized protein n=1 Tax=Rhizobium gallicum bv. gallicum R602sp TaxID=1041138 RepID=A0A0B4XEK5_9HYPH|nr:hypothetical protein RGR602_PC01495 [Rhizobium gallicum bv. gallicum R602sp]